MNFSSLTLPPSLWRESALAEKYRPEGYLDAFDHDTLWYDAIARPDGLFLICPKLNNLLPAMRKVRFRADGVPLGLRRIRRYKRHDVVELSPPVRPAQVLTVYLEGWRGESAVSAAQPERFAGKNTMFYVSQNNDLSWLVDHALFHKRLHGAEALIVMDNDSTAYGVDDIEAALAPTGLDLLVLPAPFRYGPVGLPPFRRLEKFMQTALFNVLRLRYLSQARAILSVDVDELVLTDGPSIFDAVQESRLGFIQIAGQWHLPTPGATGPFTHADHGQTANPPKPCPPKWCLRPDGLIGNWSWDIHGLERAQLLHRRTHPAFRFAHCRGVTTGWKNLNRLKTSKTVMQDALAHRCFERAGLLD
ncbi:hypothetical protein [Primorskyibacter sp. S187A]|uniref:hypothetical protein n=1 Tax=Primorskyibacter sp. S187A TaxID=3415130 RepID=UPI003C7C33E3